MCTWWVLPFLPELTYWISQSQMECLILSNRELFLAKLNLLWKDVDGSNVWPSAMLSVWQKWHIPFAGWVIKLPSSGKMMVSAFNCLFNVVRITYQSRKVSGHHPYLSANFLVWYLFKIKSNHSIYQLKAENFHNYKKTIEPVDI